MDYTKDELKRDGDSGRKPPAIPLKQRPAFVQDVERYEAKEITRSELAEKWKRYIALAQPRTLYDWVTWAKGVIEKKKAEAKPE
jgi:hypothetical protein